MSGCLHDENWAYVTSFSSVGHAFLSLLFSESNVWIFLMIDGVPPDWVTLLVRGLSLLGWI